MMNFDMLITLCIKLMGASAYDELTEHNLTVDIGGKLTKIVLESAKVRITIEKLPQVIYTNRTSITNLRMGDAITFELFNEFNEDNRRVK